MLDLRIKGPREENSKPYSEFWGQERAHMLHQTQLCKKGSAIFCLLTIFRIFRLHAILTRSARREAPRTIRSKNDSKKSFWFRGSGAESAPFAQAVPVGAPAWPGKRRTPGCHESSQ